MKIKTLRIFVLFILLFSAIQLQPSECFGGKVSVIASIFPVADMVKQVGGMYVDVVTVIPPGASPHTYEPRPSLLFSYYADLASGATIVILSSIILFIVGRFQK